MKDSGITMTDNEIVIHSLFDGMSCAQIAITEPGVKNYTYYASEVDKHAIKCTQHNFPKPNNIDDLEMVGLLK